MKFLGNEKDYIVYCLNQMPNQMTCISSKTSIVVLHLHNDEMNILLESNASRNDLYKS